MGYTVYLRAKHQNSANSMANVRLNAWLTLNGVAKGKYLYDVTEDTLVESGLGKKGFNTITNPSVLVANYSVILDNLFDLNSQDRQDFITNPSVYLLNISLKDKVNSTYSIEKLEIPLESFGGLVVEPTVNNTDIYTTKEPDPFTLVLAEDTNPPLQVLNLTSQADDGKVNLFWEKPNDPDYVGVTIKRKIGSVLLGFDDPDAISICNSTDTAWVDQNSIVNDTHYYYRAFSYDAKGNHNIAVVAQTDATPLDDYVPKVASVVVEPGNTEITIRWSEPSSDPEDDILGYIILRTEDGQYSNTYPSRGTVYSADQVLGNAKVVFKALKGSISIGTDGKYYIVDSGLSNNTLYKYSIYGYDEVPNYYNYAIIKRHQGIPTYQEGCQFSGTPLNPPILYKAASQGKNLVHVVFNQSMNTEDLKNKNAYAFNKGLAVDPNIPVTVITTSILNDTSVVYTNDQTDGEIYTVVVS